MFPQQKNVKTEKQFLNSQNKINPFTKEINENDSC